jgi:hypothetical protein
MISTKYIGMDVHKESISFFRKQPKMRVSTNSCAEPEKGRKLTGRIYRHRT